MGRPRFKIDYGIVEKLAGIMATQSEIAEILDCSTKTLQRDEEFCRIYKKGMEKGKISIRRAQWKSAVENGNTTMQIWLGKQYLGQSDRQEVTNITPDTEIKIEIINDKKQLKPKKNEP